MKTHWKLVSIFMVLNYLDHFVVLSSSVLMLEGSQTSYAQFPRWKPFSPIEFEFQTSQPNGILFYVDDGGFYDFVEVKLVNGRVRVRFNFWGSTGSGSGAHVTRVLEVGHELHMKKDPQQQWHKFRLEHDPVSGRTSVSVNDIAESVVTLAKSENVTFNSFVYVGGLPHWFATKLSRLALPSIVFEPRLEGQIRNLWYADDSSAKFQEQKVMAYKGVRASIVDSCSPNPCQNGGKCISTDVGPVCECQFIDFEGEFCERAVDPPEASFSGFDFLSYNLSQLGGEAILSTHDEISLHFKTKRPNGLLFHTGDGSNYLNLAMKDGSISLTINLGNGKLDTGVKARGFKGFDDGQWHHVVVTRIAREVTMTVDSTFSESWMTVGSFNLLSSTAAFIGGSHEPFRIHESAARNNFVGCMKKVEYMADSLHLPLLQLAKEGNKLMTTSGEIQFTCQPAKPARPVTFSSTDSHLAKNYLTPEEGVISITRQNAFLALPAWNNTIGGSLSFKFRTTEPDGLIIYNGGSLSAQGDFFALELLEGYLYLHIDLGSGAVKLRASKLRLDDGGWHNVEVIRNQKSGNVIVDDQRAAFTTPGEASNLDLSGSLFIGGIDTWQWNVLSEPQSGPGDHMLHKIPPVLWTYSLRKGFVGCIRDFIVNGKSMDLPKFASLQDSGSIRPSCSISPPECPNKPCLNGGACREGWNRFKCDCSRTSFTGPTCANPASTLQFDGTQHLSLNELGPGVTEAEDIKFRFRTRQKDALLMATRDESSTDKLEIFLESGRLRASLTMGLTEKSVTVGSDLNDDLWHTVRYNRRGMTLSLGIDDEKPHLTEIYGTESFLDATKLYLASIIPADVLPQRAPSLKGHIQNFVFNGIHYIELVRSGIYQDYSLSATFVKREKEFELFHVASFHSKKTFIGLPQMKTYYEISISFRFRTLESEGLIMFNAGKGSDFLAVELVNGHLHYVLNLGNSVISLKDSSPGPLNDDRWHSVAIHRPGEFTHTLLIDEKHLATTNSKGDNSYLNLDGILFLGGVRDSMYQDLPVPVLSKHGFLGCLASLDINGEAPDPITTALVPSNSVSSGCKETPGLSSVGSSPSSSSIPMNLVQSPSYYHSKYYTDRSARVLSCAVNPCANRGRCLRHGKCDCDLTSFTGPYCAQESVAFEWLSSPGLIRHYFNYDRRPDTRTDILTFGMITHIDDAIIMRVDSDSSNDYLEVEMVEGNILVAYQLGTNEIVIGEANVKVNDGKYHVIRFTRSDASSTLQVDDNQMQVKDVHGRQITMFNDQSQLQIGGKWNPIFSRVDRPFQGVLAGLVFNGLRPLDLAAASPDTSRTKVMGNARLLDAIPFDYQERYPRLFKHDYEMQQAHPGTGIGEPGLDDELISGYKRCTGDEDLYYDTSCFSYEGSGDELITPVYIPPTRPPWEPKIPNQTGNRDKDHDKIDLIRCNENLDDDDCVYFESEKPSSKVPEKADNYPEIIDTTEEWFNLDNDFTASTEGISSPGNDILSEDRTSSEFEPRVFYENYDPKHNVYDEEPNPKFPDENGNQGSSTFVRATAPSTILVIGIIVVAMIALILIVVIVLKTRTRMDRDELDSSGPYKGESNDSRNYRFEAGADAPVPANVIVSNGNKDNNNSGFFNGSSALATIVPKKNRSKPVREWYV